MRIIQPSYKITTPFGPLTTELGLQFLRYIEAQARISHRSGDKQTEDSWKRFLEAVVVQHGDWSVVEHAGLTVIFRVSRSVSHELVRHRIGFSYTQESQRFVRYGKNAELEFIAPAEWKAPFPWAWSQACAEAEHAYFELLGEGMRPQEARSVLPNATATTVSMTGNLRAWRNLLLQRTTKEAHPDFRQVADPLLYELQAKIPLLFDDIIAGERQIENARKAH